VAYVLCAVQSETTGMCVVFSAELDYELVTFERRTLNAWSIIPYSTQDFMS